jgi:hypothetical protein
MKNLISLLIVIILVTSDIVAQQQKFEPPMLTKEQMYEDFDQLVTIIENCNVQWPIRKEVTGYDVPAEIRKLRSNIDTMMPIHSLNEFNDLLNTILDYVMDAHTREAYYFNPMYENLNGIDTVFLKNMEAYCKSSAYRNKPRPYYFSIYPKYYEGDYYMRGNHNLVGRKKDTLNIHFMKVIAYNGVDFKQYVANNYKDSWDYKRKEFYRNKWWLPIPYAGTIKGEQDGKIIEFDITAYPGQLINVKTAANLKDVPKLSFYTWDLTKEKKVYYFSKESVLYIYLDKMIEDSTLSEFYDKIKTVGKNKKLKKVIIDVRDNKGGSDYVWHKTLSTIIKDTLPYMIQLAFNDNEMMREKLSDYQEVTHFDKISWLDNHSYGILSDTTIKIVPDSNSLKYSGKIYILTDEGTYSAAHSLVTYAEYLPQLVSVGCSTGQMVGFGIAPLLFQLKHSKFSFRLACTMDITHCTKPIDVYHDFPEIEVIPTIEEDLIYPWSGYDIKSKEYLYQYDSMFKKVLELKE